MSAVAEAWDARAAGAKPAGASAAATRGVSKVFGVTPVLKDVTIDIPVGDARALVGRNGAGKSTLVALLTGILAPTSGTVELAGQPAPPLGNRTAWRERVACVYQRWTVIPGLTVAENLFLNNQATGAGGLIQWRRVRERARAVLRDWDLDVDPDLEASRLTVEQRQVIEISRALLQGSRFIILDEPTAELERREVNRLFDRIKALQASGVTFVYISHHLEEIYEICRTVSVLRDGVLVANAPLAEMPTDCLVTAMVGEAAMTSRPARAATTTAGTGTPALVVEGLHVAGTVHDVSFAFSRGECVGLAGLAGSGKDEIGEVIAGQRRASGGVVRVEGTPLAGRSPVEARQRGVGFVPRDRHVRGNFPLLSIAENLTVTVADTLGALGFVWPSRRRARAGRLMHDLGIVASSPEQPVSELSGGNQQKGLMGRALASAPKVLVLVAPTQGVDIASKIALFRVVADARAKGTAVLVISDELDELSVCDRILVVFRGRLVASFGRERDDHALVAAIEGLAGEPTS